MCTRWGDTYCKPITNIFDYNVEYDTTLPEFDYESEEFDVLGFFERLFSIDCGNYCDYPMSILKVDQLCEELAALESYTESTNINHDYLGLKQLCNFNSQTLKELYWAIYYEVEAGFRFIPKDAELTFLGISLTLERILKTVDKFPTQEEPEKQETLNLLISDLHYLVNQSDKLEEVVELSTAKYLRGKEIFDYWY